METERLELILLNLHQLTLWIEDIQALEKELNCSYKEPPLDGVFLTIVKGQVKIIEKDIENYTWHSFWLLIRKSDRVVVGSADFKNTPNENGEVEIGYGLFSQFEHYGYMTESIIYMCNWAFKQKVVSCVIAETDTFNFASQKILQRCGFEKYKEAETIWWRLPASK